MMILTTLMIQITQTMTMMKTKKLCDPALIIVAAGSSTRMGGTKKEYLPLNGGTVLSSAAKVFLETFHFSAILITCPLKESEELQNLEFSRAKEAFFKDASVKKLVENTKINFIPGGKSRQESVYKALCALKTDFPDSNMAVFIHDGARPFVTQQIIKDTYNAAVQYGASVPGIQPVDTQNELDEKGFILRHLTRSKLTAVQTPQVFLFEELLEAHKKAIHSGKEYTDDSEIWDLFVPDGKVKIVSGDSTNKKITFKEDLKFNTGEKMIRTGLGYDKHPLVSGRDLMLGGIKIESDLGEDGHSDGDVLLHAITDALLGAAGMGDIGSFFPPSDPQWKDADSKILLKTVWDKITSAGWKLGNLDCVIALEKPKFLPHRQEVIDSIASVLNVDSEQVFVKAKTGEKLGDVGQRRAVEVWATCLLEK